MKKTRLTAYHPKGVGLVENIHNTIRSMLKARAEGGPQKWDEQLDFCMMVCWNSVHSSTSQIFELMLGREFHIPLDGVMGKHRTLSVSTLNS